MDSVCPIGFHCATEISALLTPPSPLQVQVISSFILYTFLNPFHYALFTLEEDYHNLLSARGCNGITVKQDGNSGKGFYFFIFNFNNSVICLCSIKLLNLYILHSNCFKSLIFIL